VQAYRTKPGCEQVLHCLPIAAFLYCLEYSGEVQGRVLQESPSFTTQAELLIAQAALLRPRPLTCHSQDNLVLHPSSESQFQEFKS
jgi:hypothetical protein